MTYKPASASLGRPLQSTPLKAILVAMLACFIGLELLHYQLDRLQQKQSLENLAEIIAEQSIPFLAYNDQNSAEKLLHQLQQYNSIITASIYTQEGSLFSQYKSKHSLEKNTLPAASFRLIQVSANINKKDQKLGQLIITQQHVYSLSTIESIVLSFIALLLTGLLIGYLTGKKLKRLVLMPIQDTFKKIDDFSHSDDYSLRIGIHRDDELGHLIDSVNNARARTQSRHQLLNKRIEDKSAQYYQSSHLMEQLFGQIATPALIIDNKLKSTNNNPAFRRIFGFNCAALSPDTIYKKLAMPDSVRKILLNNEHIITEMECSNTKKQTIQVRVSNPEIHSEHHQLLIFEDLSQRKQIEEALFTEKALSQTILDSIGDAVITTSLGNEILYMNPAAEKLSGRTLSEVVSLPISDLITVLHHEDNLFINEEQPKSKKIASTFEVHDCLVITLDGSNRHVEYCAAPLYDQNNKTLGKVITLRDVSELRHLAQKVEHHLAHDSSTGLLNHDTFKQQLNEALLDPPSPESPVSLIYLNIDKFQFINDVCGRKAGDKLLEEVAIIIREIARTDDPASRLESDKFAILLPGCPTERAMNIAEQIRHKIHTIDFSWQGKVYEVTASLGVVTLKDDLQEGLKPLHLGEAAAQIAKESGGNNVCEYKLDTDKQNIKRGDAQWVSRINDAFNEYKFELMFQNIAPISTNTSAASAKNQQGNHFEILIRLRDDNGNLIPPGLFLPAAERYNMMQKLDSWVINTTVLRLIENKELLSNLELCSINLSAQTLHNDLFLDYVTDLFRSSSIPSEKICFEITETVAVSNFTRAIKFINAIKQTGCRFALDDFGTGMSSFGYLKKLPIDYLKIDGMFVKNIVEDNIDYTMVKSINDIGHTMGLKTIAEFVENDAILKKLQDIGVDYAQGYGIHKPTPFFSRENK